MTTVLIFIGGWLLIAIVACLALGRLFRVLNRGNVIVFGRAISKEKAERIRQELNAPSDGIVLKHERFMSGGIIEAPTNAAPAVPPPQIPDAHRKIAILITDVLREYHRN